MLFCFNWVSNIHVWNLKRWCNKWRRYPTTFKNERHVLGNLFFKIWMVCSENLASSNKRWWKTSWANVCWYVLWKENCGCWLWRWYRPALYLSCLGFEGKINFYHSNFMDIFAILYLTYSFYFVYFHQKPFKSFKSHVSHISKCSFNSDASCLVTIGRFDRAVRIWRIGYKYKK